MRKIVRKERIPMDFQDMMQRIGLAQQGIDSFHAIHSRCADPAFVKRLEQNFAAYDQGLEVFSPDLEAFAQELGVDVAVLNLYVYIRLSERTLEEYRKRGYPEEVFYDTMKDITIDSRRYEELTGVYGISPKPHRWWITYHLACQMFRFGRLQFNFKPAPFDFELDGRLIKEGKVGLNAHISRYEPLSEEACEDSYARAKEFAKKHLGMSDPFFFCNSWLIHPWMTEDLPETSRIVQFQKKYKVIHIEQDENAVIHQVFDHECDDPHDYPEDNSLRRAAKKRLIEGKPLGLALGARL